MIRSVAYLAMHTSPLVQPGSGDGGGMNVYIDRLARTMAERGIDATVFTRRADRDTPTAIDVTPGYRVVHVEAGPAAPLRISAMKPFAPEFARGVQEWIDGADASFDLVHSHYWLSGRCGVRLKRALGVPLANSFHTLGRVKDANRSPTEPPSSPERLLTEEEVIANSDCVIASTPYEFDDLLEHYGASPERLCVAPPGVDHATFHPGDRHAARRRLGLGDEPIVLFAGRIQSHKGTETAVRTLAHLPRPLDSDEASAVLHIVGGVSGIDGEEELQRAMKAAAQLGIADRVRFFDPVPQRKLADHMRAANVVIMPSRSESFGLVAAEAQACGTPVVAADVGGLRYVIDATESGLLVSTDDPRAYATAIGAILGHRGFADRLSAGAVSFAERFSWAATATRLLELYEGITA